MAHFDADRFRSQLVVPAVQAAPAFFGKNGYSCPVNYRDGILQFAFGTKKTGFDHILSNNSLARDFNEFIGNTMGARKFWVDWYPIESRILNGAVTDKALIVDVGAGKGHDILSFKKKFPGSGRLVLQDLAGVTETIQGLDEDIEKVEYDFFTEQPIKGARAYFYHHILHDWSDECCLKILERVASAMAPGYSKLIIHDMILPEIGVSIFQAELDIAMMAFNCGAERTRSHWRALLEKAGLHIVEFWESPDDSGDGIIEAVKN